MRWIEIFLGTHCLCRCQQKFVNQIDITQYGEMSSLEILTPFTRENDPSPLNLLIRDGQKLTIKMYKDGE